MTAPYIKPLSAARHDARSRARWPLTSKIIVVPYTSAKTGSDGDHLLPMTSNPSKATVGRTIEPTVAASEQTSRTFLNPS